MESMIPRFQLQDTFFSELEEKIRTVVLPYHPKEQTVQAAQQVSQLLRLLPEERSPKTPISDSQNS